MRRQALTIKSIFGSYDVLFTPGLSRHLKNLIVIRKTHFLVDRNIWNIYHQELLVVKGSQSLQILPGEEKQKTLKTVFSYVKFLLKHGMRRDHLLVVLGGGLTQDVGSFTAHILLRGVDWIFIPTTLLAMADSCIGSKSGINVGGYKNQVGAFHPPAEVLLYPPFLQTLPQSAILDGNGEIIKHALIKGGRTFNYLTEHLHELPRHHEHTKRILYESLLVKKDIVEVDELEKGPRRVLNYGHTFGHALEGYTKNNIPHGIGVTLGMDMANHISVRRGILSENVCASVSKLLHKNIPYDTLPVYNMDTYMNFIAHDKKVVGDYVNAVLCRGIGKIEIVPVKLDRELSNDIASYFTSYTKIRRASLAS